MKTIFRSSLAVSFATLITVSAVAGPADLMVTDFSFWPGSIEPQSYPERLRFTLVNYGPLQNCDAQLEFVLSRNATLGDADDQPLATIPFSYCIDPGTGVIAELSTPDRSQVIVPADATGEYHVLLRVMPAGNTEPDPSDNVTESTNILKVIEPGPYHINFANSSIITSNMNCYPGPNFAFNGYYGNNWRFLAPAAGFTATFTPPQAGPYSLKVRHATSSSSSCPNNGFAPITINLNGTAVVTNYDVAANHASYWYQDDTWLIDAQEGENTLVWVAGELCTHYWIQRIDLAPIPQPPMIISFQRDALGQAHLEITGQSGRTNVVEFSEDLLTWSAATNLYNANGTLLWTSPVTGSGCGFYRVLELAP